MSIIEFPKLGLELNIGRVAFEVFGIGIYWYGIINAAGFILAVLVGMKNCKRYGIEQDTILDLVLYATPIAIITGRLYYVIFNWAVFRGNLLEILNTRKGGTAFYGVIIGAFATAYIFSRVRKIKFLRIIDFCMVYFPIAQAVGRWGNFVNQEAYGTHTELPWGMDGTFIENGPVHPTFLYESLWNAGVFFVLFWYQKRKKKDGELLFLYLALYGLGRSWIEVLRTDNLMLGNIRVNLLVAVASVIVFSILFVIRRRKAASDEEWAEGGQSAYAGILKDIKKDEEKEEEISSNDKEEQ